jgi:hypothetical protein
MGNHVCCQARPEEGDIPVPQNGWNKLERYRDQIEDPSNKTAVEMVLTE